MSAFERCLVRIRAVEGEYSDLGEDRGGKTRYGISQRAYPSLDIEHLTWNEAASIYRRDFWDRMGLDELPEPLAFKLMDIGVNMGVAAAGWIAQWALTYLSVPVKVDGDLGPQTRAALRSYRRLEPLLAAICGVQFDRYREIVARDARQSLFAAGWAVRSQWLPER